MKTEDKPDKTTLALQRAQREKQWREMIKAAEFLYDWLDSGESFEGLAIRLDIAAAGAGWSKSYHDFCRKVLENIRLSYEQGFGRNKVITFLRECQKADTTYE